MADATTTPKSAQTVGAGSLPAAVVHVALQALIHELHNTLTPTAAFADLARQSPLDASLRANALQRAAACAREAAEVVQTVLRAFGALPAEGIADAPTDTAVASTDAVEQIAACAAARRGVSSIVFHVEHSDPVVPVRIEAVSLRLVLMNLILNAEAAAAVARSPQIWLSSSLRREWVVLEVRDAGSGFEVGRDRGFTSYNHPVLPIRAGDLTAWTAGERPRGLGLGICRALLAPVGGRLRLDPGPGGVGTAARVWLKRAG